MTYCAFRTACVRADASANDTAHFFSRHLAVPVAYVCHRAGLSPNQVTFAFLVVGVLCGVSLYLHLPVLAYLLWRLHIILDMADGNLARATATFSDHAVGFDQSNHIVINTTVLLAPLAAAEAALPLINLLIVSFYLHYFFTRNFQKGGAQTQSFSLRANLLKNAIGLEGYLIAMIVLILSGTGGLIVTVALVYAGFFALLFLVKLARYLRQ